MTDVVRKDLLQLLTAMGIPRDASLVTPPDPRMGDIAFPCFELAKTMRKSPGDVAREIAEKLAGQETKSIIERVEAAGPYVNFFLNGGEIARRVLTAIRDQQESFGRHTIGEGQTCLVEYACPNPMKAFHIGHLRNTITGESVCRILEHAGYRVIRVNYQGDVGMHIAKSIWGLQQLRQELEDVLTKPLSGQVGFLGRAYAHGATAFEEDQAAKEEIIQINKKVYAKDESILELYEMGREWSLEYFHTIYTRLGTQFDELYFESEVWERGLQIVKEFLTKGVFRESDGAIIFPGSEYGLHDRVFITGEGNPTYEAKDLALSERRFQKHHPDRVIHVVGKEQTEYFKVVFKALEYTLPESIGKESHLPGGYLQTKGGKMSSRTGKVVLATDLLYETERAVGEIMQDNEMSSEEKAKLVQHIATAAVKYAILRVGVSDDVLFDVQESVNTHGESGPYLLYIVARIRSILRKLETLNAGEPLTIPAEITLEEKRLLLTIAGYGSVTLDAAIGHDPSKIARYLFELAQLFNRFYETSPVLKAEELVTRNFRKNLIQAVEQVMEQGLYLLGIETVEKM